MNIIAYSVWLGIPKEERYKIAEAFNLSKTGAMEVMDGRIVSDYYSPTDVASLSVERMCEFAGIKTNDVYEAFTAVRNKLNGISQTKEEERGPEAEQGVDQAPAETKRRVAKAKSVRKK